MAGHCHVLALSDGGHLYSWGSNGHGQLGLNTKQCATKPTPVLKDMERLGYHTYSQPCLIYCQGCNSVVVTLSQLCYNLVTILLASKADESTNIMHCLCLSEKKLKVPINIGYIFVVATFVIAW